MVAQHRGYIDVANIVVMRKHHPKLTEPRITGGATARTSQPAVDQVGTQPQRAYG